MLLLRVLPVLWGILYANGVVWLAGLYGVDRWWPPDWFMVLVWNVFLWIVIEGVWLSVKRETWDG